MILLENRTNINARDKFGRTLLEKAAARGDKGMVRFMLENRAEIA